MAADTDGWPEAMIPDLFSPAALIGLRRYLQDILVLYLCLYIGYAVPKACLKYEDTVLKA